MFESTVFYEKSEVRTDLHERDEKSVIGDGHLSVFAKH